MSTIVVTGGPQARRPALVLVRRIGAVLACLAAAFGPPGWARAEDGRVVRRVAQAPAHDMSSHNAAEPARAALPPALPEPTSAPVTPRTPAPAGAPAAPPGLADFERLALARNPTLSQAAAQVDAAMSRSY